MILPRTGSVNRNFFAYVHTTRILWHLYVSTYEIIFHTQLLNPLISQRFFPSNILCQCAATIQHIIHTTNPMI